MVEHGERKDPGFNYELMWNHLLWDRDKTTCDKVHKGITVDNTRFQIFKGNVDFILTTNAQNLSYRLKANE